MLLDRTIEFAYAYTTPMSYVHHLPIREIENPNIARVERMNFYYYKHRFQTENDPRSAYFLGLFYIHKRPNRDFLHTAIDYLEMAHNRNCWEASLLLYDLYAEPGLEDLEKDLPRALTYLEHAYSLHPIPELGNQLGDMYANGDGTDVNYEKAKEYFVKGVLQNDETAQARLTLITSMLRRTTETAAARSFRRARTLQIFKEIGVKVK